MNTEVQQFSQVTGLLRRMDLSYAAGLWVVLVVVVLTHVPMPFQNLGTDDYLIRANIVGDETLYDKGMILADPDKSMFAGLSQAFHFYSYGSGTVEAYKEYGNLPWWVAEEPKMNPWRPISAFTHWLDYQIAPDSFQFQALHSLIYLMLYGYCAYRLFWRFSPRASVAVLATLFLVVDYSHFINFSWVAARNVFIAAAAGCFMLERFIIWREQRRTGSLLLSLGMFAVALLSGEGSVALAGYLFAYLLLVEKAPLRTQVVALLPYGLLVVSWRLLYNYMGHGASGISLYVDPVRSPMEFLEAVVTTVPVLAMSAITTLDGFIPSIAPGFRLWAVVLSALVALIGIWLVMPLLRTNAWVRCLLLGTVLAAIPASALVSAGSRNGVFIAIGFFWILALWLHGLLHTDRSRLKRLFAQCVIAVHLILPGLVSFLVSSTLLPVAYTSDMQYESVATEMEQADGKRDLVVVNSRAPNREFYLPFTWRFEYGVVPDSVNALAPGLTSFYLTRTSEHEFELEAPVGLPLTSDSMVTDLDGEEPAVSEVYYLLMLQGLFTDAPRQYQVGDVLESGHLQARVLGVTDGRPTRIGIEFDSSVDPDSMLWQWYDWKERSYRAMNSLAPGETRFFPGPLDVEKADIVELDVCLDCEEDIKSADRS